ncbi:hypothetical protein Snoj_27980 [Streptomyces nojiriensis]|uniref:HEAT repeat domain-containing protein n=1 Tax=Streptomyces nojiriensis TaxID=66374 RepID=A0ABQ3SM28_9ACTN|nr:hypothetical protein [Streptomyces nojiriensis]QTI42479.1 hypothetical protein JYK04_00237 [Streptomyces nojiriensis]GGS38116.1 hypothetical protein GCM10010205_79890 [Streptomyces nojiriensis]GHI68880.1 hypothetical protein Snoj_27980 [Streptomyces nojiriensis]
MTSDLSTSEWVFSDELLLEGRGGPDALYVRDQARGVCRVVHAGAAIAPDDTGSLVGLLGDPQAFVNEPTEPANLREESRRHITEALLIHACRTDDPDLVRRLRQVAPSEVHGIDLRLLIPEQCLLALFDGLDQEELGVRHAAMRMVGNIYQPTDITPLLDIIVSELASPAHGRGYHRVAPADGARWALVAHSLETDDFDGLCNRVSAAIAPSAPTQSALRTLAALYAVAEQFDQVISLVGRASTRASVIGGIHDAICKIAWNLELAWPVPNSRYPFAEAIAVADGLATNTGHRKQVEDIRKRHNRLRPAKASSASSPSAT